MTDLLKAARHRAVAKQPQRGVTGARNPALPVANQDGLCGLVENRPGQMLGAGRTFGRAGDDRWSTTLRPR